MYSKSLLIIAFLILMNIHSAAQRNMIFNNRIKTLQVVAGIRWLDMPIIALNSDEVINISFDDMTHEYHRYTYKIEHCEADWAPSKELFESDYIDGFAEGNTIDDSQESLNTNELYTHYKLELPNERCKMKLSGNYKVTVYDENNDKEKMFEAFFMVNENLAGISMTSTSNTDYDINGLHQQLSIQLNYGNLSVTDWKKEIKTIVLQNGRWDNAVTNPTPQYIMSDGLKWEHNKALIFNGGNEYHKFELLDVYHPTMGVERVNWDGKEYHAYLWTDEPRPSYIYDEDADGAYFIRNSDNTEIDYTAQYMTVHFRLKAPKQDGDVYLNGNWTYDLFIPEYKMEWNSQDECYECSVQLKQGYYNYQYLVLGPDGVTIPVTTEGNFFQTENKYQALVYYKGVGERTDRLVGIVTLDK
ncbi:MAG: DUF5103 domain-containing protein [Prevotella sp.]|jgi:hypothetical protein|nr:DUF5103 domain-containing protein [Prevotella sp.]